MFLGAGGFASAAFAAIAAALFVGGLVGLLSPDLVIQWLPIALGLAVAAIVWEFAFLWELAILAAIGSFAVVAVVVFTGLSQWGWPL